MINKKVIKTFAFGVSIVCGLAVSGLFASSASADDLTSGNISYARSVFAPVKVAYSYSDSSNSKLEPAKDFKAPAIAAYSDSSSSEFEPAKDFKAPAIAAYSDSSSSEFEPAIASLDDVTEPITDNDNMIKLAKLPDYNQSNEYLANLDNSQEYDVNVDDINDDDVNVDDIDFEAIDLDNLNKFASEDVANRCKYTTGGDCAPLPPYASILDGKDHDADNNSGDIDDIDIDDFNVDNLDLDDLDGNRLDVVSNVDSNSNDNNDNSNESNTNDDSNSNNSNAVNASNESNTVNVVSERHDRLSDLHKEVSGRDSHNFAPTLPVPGSQYYYYHNN